jgi:undecaprenyl-diphosphatase
MAIWQAIILGFVQGLTEFLPVSSSGHLLLLQYFFGIEDSPLLFDIILHLATLTAVIIVLRKKIWQLIRKPFQKTTYCLIVATAITCVMVLIAHFAGWTDLMRDYRILPITFMITAIALFVVTILPKRKEGDVTYKTGIIAGIAQGIAVIPGISRSGATIAASFATGVKREEAAEFAFLMSIPIIVASFVFELINSGGAVASMSFWPVALGFIAALISGIFAIKVMLALVKRIKLYWFSIYLVVLAIILSFVFYL